MWVFTLSASQVGYIRMILLSTHVSTLHFIACQHCKLFTRFCMLFYPILFQQTIVQTLPYLTQISDEEWLPLAAFEKCSDTWLVEGEHCVCLYNQSTQLKTCNPGSWRIKYTGRTGSWHYCKHVYFVMLKFDLVRIHVLNSYSASRDNWCTVGGDGGCRVGEVRADTTSPMPDHKGFKLQ